MTGKQARTAARIDAAMQPLLCDGKDYIAILTGMGNHMTDFKHLIDTAKLGVMDELCRRYPGFYRYAKVFEGIAGAVPVRRHHGAEVNMRVMAFDRGGGM